MSSALLDPQSTRPQPGPPREYRFPAFERLSLGNGMGLLVAPVAKLPIVTVRMVISGGATSEPAGQEGVAQLTARSLIEGTRRLDGADLIEQFERLGGAIEASAEWDSAVSSMTVLSSRFDEAFALFADVLREPAFPEREVERLKAERLAELLQLRTEPRGLADDMFARFLYVPGSRYALPEGGTGQSVQAIDRGSVEAFYQRVFAPAGMTLVVAGDVRVDAVQRMAEQRFGDWTADGAPVPRVIDDPARRFRAVHIVAKTDAPQSELRIGHVGVPRNHPDYFPILVMNSILGGLFSSRINLNLREVHGYTYGAWSAYDWRRGSGPFFVSSAVKSDVTDDAAREVLVEVDRIRADGVASDELSLATSYLAGVFPIKYETTSAIAQALSALVVYGLPADYFDTYRDNVLAVGIPDVLHAADEHLHPAELQLVVVGDPESIHGPLESLELGPVTVYDTDGNPVLPGR